MKVIHDRVCEPRFVAKYKTGIKSQGIITYARLGSFSFFSNIVVILDGTGKSDIPLN